MRSKIRLGVSFVLACVAMPSFGAIVNFGVLSQAGSGANLQGASYAQDGFTFSVVSGGHGAQMAAWQNSSIHHPVGGPSATSLTSYYAAGIVTIARTDNSLFNASSIDLAPWGAGQNPPATFDVTLTGTKSDNSTIQNMFTVSNTTGVNPPVLQTKNFTGFNNLKKITLVQGFYANSGTAWQFNNFTAAPVPEPFTMGLVGCALATAVARRRARRA